MSIARDHAEWLSLLEISGPFLINACPNAGIPLLISVTQPKQKSCDSPTRNGSTSPMHRVATRHGWILLLPVSWSSPLLILEGQNIFSGLEAPMSEYGETVRADIAVVAPTGQSVAGAPQLLIQIYPPGQKLDSPVAGKHWKASPATRMTELLHVANVSLGIVTNGEQWMLVFAPRGESTGYASFYAALWQEEPITLRAFHSLFHVKRFFGVAEGDTLLTLLRESAQDQQEVTDQLGLQVRHAVEVLVQALDRLDQDTGRQLLHDTDTKVLYEAALTVMMRLVFLFSAEERGLLRLGEPLYDDNYAISSLSEQLRETADQHGEEVLERRFDAWARLLATFRAVHGGVSHESMRLPAYGGTLFDPDRFPFLEGRKAGTSWKETAAQPLAVNNRVVLHLLESLQLLQVKVPGGGPAEARRLSFRALDIEQIGHVYEGLLDHTAVRASTTILGLRGTKDKEPEISLETMEGLLAQGEDKLIEFLKEETKRSESALRRTLRELLSNNHKLLIECGQNTTLRDRILPFAGLLRDDSFEMPVVVLAGGVYVTQGTTRRSSGTHYTPRSLTEPIVQHTLEPLVNEGPAAGWSKEKWKLKSPREILSIKVCDIATGSGAFLVQSCRYMAERLVEAWENLEQANPGRFIVAPEGDLSAGDPSERLLPKDPAERLAIARRAVADRCLYGVDINPLAVEMAKLSLWLVTLQKDRPFTFLNHAIKCGDSLLGICRLSQLETFNLNDAQAKQVLILSNYEELIQNSIAKRRKLESLPSDNSMQIALKEALNVEAEEQLYRLKLAADLLIAATLSEGNEQQKEEARMAAHLKVIEYADEALADFYNVVYPMLRSRKPFHFPLEFPEVFDLGGFDVFVGNPPYMGGQKITGVFGDEYRDYLIDYLANGKRGSADLAAYFLLRLITMLRSQGTLGLVTTSSIAEGKTRDVGLARVIEKGAVIYRAVQKADWPGAANVTYCPIWICKGTFDGDKFLDNQKVERISPSLEATDARGETQAFQLLLNDNITFQGSIVLGMGFIINEAEATELITADRRNNEVILPYLTGNDINSTCDFRSGKFAINFFNWPLDRSESQDTAKVAADYPLCLKIIEDRVKPERTRTDKDGKFVLRRPLPQKWWIYGEKRPALYAKFKTLRWSMCVATAATKYLNFAIIRDPVVFSHSLSVVASDSFLIFACLNSSIHDIWARKYSSSNLQLIRYTPTTSLLTFPFPDEQANLVSAGETYATFRETLMRNTKQGFVDLYNRVHDPSETSREIQRLRTLQMEMDQAVATAYGWPDLELNHDFHETKEGLRFTVSNDARPIVLERLMYLNHKRYAEEVKAGLHDKKAKVAARQEKRGRNRKNTSAIDEPKLL